jgi:hypothetical protein
MPAPAYDSPVLRQVAWYAWIPVAVWPGACAGLLQLGVPLLVPLVPVWILLLAVALYWWHLALLRCGLGLVPLVVAGLLALGGGAWLAVVAGWEAAVTAPLTILALSGHGLAAGGTTGRLLQARGRLARALFVLACLLHPLWLPCLLAGAVLIGISLMSQVPYPAYVHLGLVAWALAALLLLPAPLLGWAARRRAQGLRRMRRQHVHRSPDGPTARVGG